VDLFDSPAPERPVPPAPLADRMRPRTLDEVVGQQHLIGSGKVLAGLAKRIEASLNASSVGTPADIDAALARLNS